MNVELRHLRVVVLVAEAGSVGRAARWLKVSQPSLTAQLKRIEAAFGGELFERSRTGVTPTPLGRYAVDRARAILVDVDHLSATVSAMTAVESSAARLGGFPTAPMSGIASRLRDHGEIEQVSIEVEWSTSVLLQQLESGRLDFALLREFPGFELRLPSGVEAITVVESESAYVVMSADHPMAVGVPGPRGDRAVHAVGRGVDRRAAGRQRVPRAVPGGVRVGWVPAEGRAPLGRHVGADGVRDEWSGRRADLADVVPDALLRRHHAHPGRRPDPPQAAAGVEHRLTAGADGAATCSRWRARRTTRPSPSMRGGISTSACTSLEFLGSGRSDDWGLERGEVELAGVFRGLPSARGTESRPVPSPWRRARPLPLFAPRLAWPSGSLLIFLDPAARAAALP